MSGSERERALRDSLVTAAAITAQAQAQALERIERAQPVIDAAVALRRAVEAYEAWDGTRPS